MPATKVKSASVQKLKLIFSNANILGAFVSVTVLFSAILSETKFTELNLFASIFLVLSLFAFSVSGFAYLISLLKFVSGVNDILLNHANRTEYVAGAFGIEEKMKQRHQEWTESEEDAKETVRIVKRRLQCSFVTFVLSLLFSAVSLLCVLMVQYVPKLSPGTQRESSRLYCSAPNCQRVDFVFELVWSS